MGRTVRVKSFELAARDINEVDVKLLHALSIGVGWPHRPTDWNFLRRAGHGIVAVDGIGRVFGSAMWFPHGREFATIGLVITSPRTQALGTGRWLMEQVFERCDDRNLTLNSTDAAYHLYLSLGFTKEATALPRSPVSIPQPGSRAAPRRCHAGRPRSSRTSRAASRDSIFRSIFERPRFSGKERSSRPIPRCQLWTVN